VLVKRKVAFLSEGAWSSAEYLKSALLRYENPQNFLDVTVGHSDPNLNLRSWIKDLTNQKKTDPQS
jgi:hypothetical protein